MQVTGDLCYPAIAYLLLLAQLSAQILEREGRGGGGAQVNRSKKCSQGSLADCPGSHCVAIHHVSVECAHPIPPRT